MISPTTRIIDLTVSELENLFAESVKKNFQQFSSAMSLSKEFFTPKEFSHMTGVKYSTVIYRCKIGKLKARQDTPASTWQIHFDELDRYRKEASENGY